MSKMDKAKQEKLAKELQEKLAKFQDKNKKICKTLDVSASAGLEDRVGRNGAIPSSLLSVDLITGGGFPKHRLTMISGVTGAGKTTLMQSAIMPQLRAGGLVHYADMEGSADPSWMKAGGIDVGPYEGGRGKIQTFWPLFDFQNGEDCYNYISRNQELSVELGLAELPMLANLFLVDSIPSLVPGSVIENDEGGAKPEVAILAAAKVPSMRGRFKRSNSAMIWVNQIRQKIRVGPYENPEYEPGGNAVQFYSDLKLMLHPGNPKDPWTDEKHVLVDKDKAAIEFKKDGLVREMNPDGTFQDYVYRSVYTKKNRVFAPLKTTYFRICVSNNGGDGTGFDHVFDTLNFFQELRELQFLKYNEISFRGKTYTYYDLKKELMTRPDLRLEAISMLEDANNTAYEKYRNRFGENFGTVNTEEEDMEALDKTAKAEEEKMDPVLAQKTNKGKGTKLAKSTEA